MEKKKENLLMLLSGAFVGLVNGIFGGGGGMLVVPLLVALMKKNPKVAHATAIAVILPISLVSGILYVVFGNFDIRVGIPVTAGVLAGRHNRGVSAEETAAEMGGRHIRRRHGGGGRENALFLR